jgi:hypothetical protein
MNTATHAVEVPFPQAFASPKRSPFPCAPRYGLFLADTAIDNPTVRWECALLRGSTQPITTMHRNNLIRECFYRAPPRCALDSPIGAGG